ncbi:MAG: sulfatase-like hydrolase/transferase [Gemmataceae bacterium]
MMKWIGYVFGGLLLLAGAGRAEPMKRPNILLLFADDQRADTIAAWGNPHIHTPHLDKLAGRGFRFRNAYCFGSNSGAVCVPSRAMLMSGRSWLHVKHDLAGVRTLPEVLRDAGYSTFATGKWHNGDASLRRAFPEARSVFLGGMSDHTKTPVADIVAGKLTNKRQAEKFSSEQFADAAIGFLENHRGPEPFFCYVAFTAPHDPRNPPEAYRQRYYQKPPPLPANFRPLPAFDNGFTKNIRDENLAGYPRPESAIRDQLCEYYGLITHLDEQVGRILATLEKTGRARDTIVIYTADHGLALGSHGLLGKQSLYEHSMKPPFIVAGPGVPAGGSSDAFAYLFDLFPTLCDLARAKTPEGLAGQSLRPVWTGEKKSLRDTVFLPFGNLMRSIREGPWKLIVYPPIGHRELFHLEKDPHEVRNVAEEQANAATVERLLDRMRAAQKDMGDTQPLSVAKPRPKEVRFDDFERKPDPWQPDWIVKKYFTTQASSNPPAKPNVVIVYCDDLGYGDLGCYGHPSIRTPNLDRMAREGMKFTNFYSAASVCTPSRAALMTGRLPIRSGMCSDTRRVLFPDSAGGLPADEITLARALKRQGYVTACVGKWHLGHRPEFLPTRHGFDRYFGIPYSNDMDRRANVGPKGREAFREPRSAYWNVPLLRGEKEIERPADQPTLTRRYTDEAVQFVREHRSKPFFLYLAHSMPHVPLFASPAFAGKSERGLYGDVVEELDAGVGRLLATLREEKMDRNTLVFFSSDNGPWLVFGDHGGSAGLLREGKGSTWEGGMRVPGIAWWPGTVPAGVTTTELACTMDLFTTAVKLAGGAVPDDRVIDGVDLTPVLTGQGKSPREAMFYYRGTKLYAVRWGPWKAHFITQSAYGSDKAIEHELPPLYHLGRDPGEKTDVAKQHPEVLTKIRALAQEHRRGVRPVASQLEKRLPAEKK